MGSGRLFADYAARILSPGDRVVSRRDVVDEPPINEIAALLPTALLERMVRTARGGAAVSDLLSTCEAPPDQAWFAVLWLLKHGILALA